MDLPTLLIIVFFAALVTCLATGLGAVPFLFVPEVSKRLGAAMEGLAAGMMAAASVYLVIEGLVYTADASTPTIGQMPWLEVGLGLASGLLFYLLAGRWLEEHEDFDVAGLRKAGGVTSILIVGAMFAHSLPEGVAVGVGFGVANPDIGQGLGFGGAISTAIAFHNVPEGLAISIALRAKGLSVGRCALWAIVSSIPQPLAAPFAAWLSWIFVPLLPAGMGFAAGAMLALVAMELAPNAFRAVGPARTIAAILVGAALMTGLSLAITSFG